MGAFVSHGLPLPCGIEAILPARQTSDFDQDVIAHKRGDRFSQAAFTVMDGGTADAHSRCASEGWGTLSRFSEPPCRNWPEVNELYLVFPLKTGGGDSGRMTQFDHAALLRVRRLLCFVGDQFVDQQLDRIERFRAAAVQPEREDLAD